MRRLRIQNPLLDKTFKTFISTDYLTSATTTLEVLNTTSFAGSDILVIGEPTEEKTEQGVASVITDINTITLSATLNFDHAKGTSIYKSPWNQVSIEGRSSSAGTFAELVQTAIQWDSKNNETIYYHTAGTDDWEYRFRFYNSIASTYAEYSPTITGVGFTKNQVGYMIRNVRIITNDRERKIVSDDELIRFFNAAQDIIYGHNPKYWFLLVDTYKQGTGISVVGGTSVYSLASYTDLGHLDRLRYYYSSGSTTQIYDLKNQPAVEFDTQIEDLTLTGNDYASEYKLIPADSSSDQGYVQIFPKPLNSSVATLYPMYYKVLTNLNSVDDETPIALPNLIENYAIAQVEKIKGDETKAAIYEKLFYGTAPKRTGYEVAQGLELLDQLDQSKKRPQGQPRSLWNFRGQKGAARMFSGGAGRNHDYEKENYF